MCRRLKIAFFIVLLATVNTLKAAESPAVRDSVKIKQARTIQVYEDFLELLTNWYYEPTSLPYTDSLYSPSPYYYKFLSPEVVFEEPLREAIKLEWTPTPPSRQTQPLSLGDLRDRSLLLNHEINRVMAATYIDMPTSLQRLQGDLSERADVPKVKTPTRQEVKLAEKAPVVDQGLLDVGSVDIVAKKPNFWKFTGYYQLKFSQFHYSDNWHRGGDNTNQLFAKSEMNLNYNNKQKVQFDNKLEMWLGFQTTNNDEQHKFRTNSDLLRLTNTLGLKAIKNWNYTIKSQASTQFYPSYRANDPKVYADFMSPLNLVVSLGMEYKLSKPKYNVTASFAPIAYNFKYIDRVSLGPSHGFKERHSTYNHFGPSINITGWCQVAKNLTWNTRIYWFSNLERTQIEWENVIRYKLSKYFSAELFLYPRIDDSSPNFKNENGRYFMFQQYFNFGFEYSI